MAEIPMNISSDKPTVAANLEQLRYLVFHGMQGDPGQSAYDLAVSLGFEGTEAEWIASLHGADGKNYGIVVDGSADDVLELKSVEAAGAVTSVNGQSGAVTITAESLGALTREKAADMAVKWETDLGSLNCRNLLNDYTPSAGVYHGVTFTPTEDGGVRVSGTSTDDSFYNFYFDLSALPGNMQAGKTYRAFYDGSAGVKFQFWFYKNGAYLSGYRISGNRDDLKIPDAANGAVIRLAVDPRVTVNEVVHPQIVSCKTNAELTEAVSALREGIEAGSSVNPNARMRSFGNSILTGSVWKNGAFHHLSGYANAPYANVAAALHIPQSNVSHTLLSSTGLMYDAGSGSFLTNIKNTDLSGYDYLLTHFWTADMGAAFPLGSLQSAADDGTLAGAVLSLLEHIEASNGLCTLVLVSVPPVRGASDVFTHTYGNGSTISDLDALMQELAARHHFVYLDWQSMDLSRRYQDYTDGDNVHANNEDTYRVMGEYLGRKVNGQARPKQSESGLGWERISTGSGGDLELENGSNVDSVDYVEASYCAALGVVRIAVEATLENPTNLHGDGSATYRISFSGTSSYQPKLVNGWGFAALSAAGWITPLPCSVQLVGGSITIYVFDALKEVTDGSKIFVSGFYCTEDVPAAGGES